MSSLIKTNYTRMNNHKKCKTFAKQQIDRTIRKAYSGFNENTDCRNMFQQMLLHIQIYTDLLKTSADHGRRWHEACTYIRGLRNLAFHHADFIRPVQIWRPSEGSGRKAFASLVHHLLAEYPAPFFMNSAWLRETDDNVLQQQNWYIKVSRGHSIRRLDIPVFMTRKMEHIFLKAPDHFSVEEAMRYSQVMGLGGNKELAKAVIATRLGTDLENDDFWKSVIHFFINNKDDLKTGQINPVIDFLYHTKFVRKELLTETGVVFSDPPQPGFSMKGRTFNSIMRLVEEWHRELSFARGKSNFRWRKSAFNDFLYLEESRNPKHSGCIWSITELLTGADLVMEGRMMRHCVRSYTSDCFHGKTTIWSVKREVDGAKKRVLTIELNPATRVIRQARGKCNRAPDKKSFKIMIKWAKREGLRLGMHL